MAPSPPLDIEDFLRPLELDLETLVELSKRFCETYKTLAAESENQFLGTPISESLLKPNGDEAGRYLAIDIGGTNLRVGFVELLGQHDVNSQGDNFQFENGGIEKEPSRVNQTHKSWPIGEKLKNEKAEDLFAWIGECIADVIEEDLPGSPELWVDEHPMGVTFSFPMIQKTLSEAILMFMGKGFAITSNLDLGKQLLSGYESARTRRTSPLPGIKIEAIANDSVATLLALMYRWQVHSFRKPAMGLIVGTGTNATIPLKLGMLHPSKHPEHLTSHSSTSTEFLADQKIIVNTEWTINGAVRPLQELHIITPWDLTLDAACDAPGFQPFEYMTGGRYLGELSRLIILDYFTTHLCIPASLLPRKLLTRNALTTSFLGSLSPHSTLLQRILEELPPPSSASTSPDHETFTWTQTTACLVYAITKSVQSRAAGLTAAATIGLLACAGDLSLSASLSSSSAQEIVSDNAIGGVRELIVGYTGGCIENFLDYLGDTQGFLDAIMGFVNAGGKYGNKGEGLRVLLKPVCDGGIIGAGVLAGMVRTSSTVAARTV